MDDVHNVNKSQPLYFDENSDPDLPEADTTEWVSSDTCEWSDSEWLPEGESEWQSSDDCVF